MSRIWVDDDEPTRDQISTKRALLIIAVLVVVLLLATSCSIKSMDPVELPARTESQSLDMEVCQEVITDTSIMISDLIPDNWDQWCRGFIAMHTELQTWPASDHQAFCSWFWETPDSLIQDGLMDEGFSSSESIGGVDASWVFCG